MRHLVRSWLVVCAALVCIDCLQAQVSVDPYGATVGPAFGYTATGQRARFRSIAGKPDTLYYPFGGGLATPEDDGFVSLALPFNFRFFNQVVPAGNPIFASANGFLLFGTTSTTVVPTNLLIEPASFGNQPALSPMFADLIARGQQSGGPGLYVQTLGTEGNRQYTVEWSSMQHFNNGEQSKIVSFQVSLFEANGGILFNYDTTWFGSDADFGKLATVGIRDTTFSDPPDNVLQWGFQAGTPGGEGIGLGESDFQISFSSFAAVPEPTSMALTAVGSLGLLGTVWYRRRMQRKQRRQAKATRIK